LHKARQFFTPHKLSASIPCPRIHHITAAVACVPIPAASTAALPLPVGADRVRPARLLPFAVTGAKSRSSAGSGASATFFSPAATCSAFTARITKSAATRERFPRGK
jgi:hypothetical protein